MNTSEKQLNINTNFSCTEVCHVTSWLIFCSMVNTGNCQVEVLASSHTVTSNFKWNSEF